VQNSESYGQISREDRRYESQVPGDTKYDIFKIPSWSLIVYELVRII
jgi:hypothetical protein